MKSENEEEKPRCQYELYVEKYFGLPPAQIAPGVPNEKTVILGVDYGILVDLLAGFHQELQKQNPTDEAFRNGYRSGQSDFYWGMGDGSKEDEALQQWKDGIIP